jgi:hypothetical protein
MAPVSISVTRGGQPVESYRMQMVADPLLSPLLIQMAVSSCIQATERTVGASTVRVTGEVGFANAPAPVKFDNMYAMDTGTADQAALAAAVPAAYVMQAGFRSLDLKNVDIRIETYDVKKALAIDGVTVSRRQARPGETLRLMISLVGENGAETMRNVDYAVPIGAQPGTLYFTVADAGVTNLADFRQILSVSPRNPTQLIATVNNLHPNNKAYVRVWRADPAFQLEGADLPGPPASAAMILAGSQSGLAGIVQSRNSKIAEMESDGGEMVVTGSKTVQVEIKE